MVLGSPAWAPTTREFETLEPILSTVRPQQKNGMTLVLRRERADPMLRLRRSCDFLRSFRSSLLRSCQLLLVQHELVARLLLLGLLSLALSRSAHSRQQSAAAFLSCSTSSELSALTAAFARPVHTTPVPHRGSATFGELLKKNISCAADRMRCLFQAHELNENSL